MEIVTASLPLHQVSSWLGHRDSPWLSVALRSGMPTSSSYSSEFHSCTSPTAHLCSDR